MARSQWSYQGAGWTKRQRPCASVKFLDGHTFVLPILQLGRIASSLSIVLLAGGAVHAQIVPDTTLSTNSIATPNGDIITITGGTQSGSHLFHSFDAFSIAPDQTARFDHSLNLDTLITRVTGASISTIEGILETQGSTDFFLLNPNGIVFSETAQLNVGGSFIASTADSVQFDDGTSFSATTPQTPPLLTINTPTGLQYGAQPGDIVVNGTGHNLTIDDSTLEVITTNRPNGLAVNAGNTLALLGGSVTLNGGNVTAQEGRIIVGGIGPNSGLELQSDDLGWSADFSSTSQVEAVLLENASSIVTSGNGAGAIHIAGQFIDVLDGSVLLANTSGNADGNSITLQASEELVLAGVQVDNSSQDILFPSSILAEVDIDATGNGGAVELSALFISISDGAYVSTSIFGSGNGGDVNIRSGEIELVSGTSEFGASGFLLDVNDDATGNGGTINIETDQLSILGGANISASTLGLGDAGQVNIVANSIDVSGGSADLGASVIFSQVEGRGNGGNIQIDTDFLQVTGGAEITTDVFGAGDGGGIDIIANTINVEGTSPSGAFASNIASTVQSDGGIGRGGDINIQTNQLLVTNGAEITSETFSASRQGQAGDITIEAESIQVVGTDDISTGIFASVNIDPDGNIGQGDGGQVLLQTDQLTVQDGAQIVVGTRGPGNAGDVIIAANSITLDGRNNRGASGLFASALRGTGEGGKIIVNADALVVQDGATVNASNFASNNANVSSGQDAAGEITLNARTLDLRNEGTVTTSTSGGDRGNIVLNSDLITLSDRSSITTNAQSTDGGNIRINTRFLVANGNSDITANAFEDGNGGSIRIATRRIFGLEFRDELTPENDITVSSSFGTDGEVIIDLQGVDSTSDLGKLPNGVVDESDRVATGCPADSGANFIATGRGGVPADPTQSLVEDVLLHAFETTPSNNFGSERQSLILSDSTIQAPNPPLAPPRRGTGVWQVRSTSQSPLIEAQAWHYDAQGQVQLWHPMVGGNRRGTSSPMRTQSDLFQAPSNPGSAFCQGGQNG